MRGRLHGDAADESFRIQVTLNLRAILRWRAVPYGLCLVGP